MLKNIHQKFTSKENELRLYIMNFIIDEKRPFHLERDKQKALQALEMTEKEYQESADCLVQKDGMVADEAQHVNFIYPVSALPTNHQVTLQDGRSFTAMCAIDAMGSAFTFHQDIEIHSVCTGGGEPVYVKIKNGEMVEHSPKGLYALTFPLGELQNWAGSC